MDNSNTSSNNKNNNNNSSNETQPRGKEYKLTFVADNKERLTKITQMYLDNILNSLDNMPRWVVIYIDSDLLSSFTISHCSAYVYISIFLSLM